MQAQSVTLFSIKMHYFRCTGMGHLFDHNWDIIYVCITIICVHFVEIPLELLSSFMIPKWFALDLFTILFLFFAKNSVEFNVCSPVQFNLMAEPINSKANYLNALFKATARKNIDILHHCISAHCPIVFYIFDLLFLLILVVWNFQRTLFRYSELLLYLRSWDSCCFHFCYG